MINDSQAGHELALFHLDGTASALGNRTIAEGEDVGATNVFARELDGQLLTFSREGDLFIDAETGSSWNIVGQAVAGPLAGEPAITYCPRGPFLVFLGSIPAGYRHLSGRGLVRRGC